MIDSDGLECLPVNTKARLSGASIPAIYSHIDFSNSPKSAETAWVIAASTFGFFLIVNAGLLWFDDRPWRYFFYSIGFAAGYLLITAIIMPGLVKALKVEKSEESAMAFLILIYQPFALLLVMLTKWLVEKWF